MRRTNEPKKAESVRIAENPRGYLLEGFVKAILDFYWLHILPLFLFVSEPFAETFESQKTRTRDSESSRHRRLVGLSPHSHCFNLTSQTQSFLFPPIRLRTRLHFFQPSRVVLTSPSLLPLPTTLRTSTHTHTHAHSCFSSFSLRIRCRSTRISDHEVSLPLMSPAHPT